jgi:hypothetical protein
LRGPRLFEIDPPRKLGVFTLVEPRLRGEIVRISLPLGGFVMGAVESVAAANQRRREAAARRRVNTALKSFTEQHQDTKR